MSRHLQRWMWNLFCRIPNFFPWTSCVTVKKKIHRLHKTYNVGWVGNAVSQSHPKQPTMWPRWKECGNVDFSCSCSCRDTECGWCQTGRNLLLPMWHWTEPSWNYGHNESLAQNSTLTHSWRGAEKFSEYCWGALEQTLKCSECLPRQLLHSDTSSLMTVFNVISDFLYESYV